MISHLAKSKDTLLPPDLLKPVLTCLVNGTMEKNSMVKSCRSVTVIVAHVININLCFSETALVDVLHMRKGPQGQQQVPIQRGSQYSSQYVLA